MRIVFMGTPAFAVPSLTMLLARGYEVVAVVTQPDRPKGRKRVLTPSPVKVAAIAAGLPVLQPERLRHPDAVAELASYKPDLIVTAAYGQILPKSVLEMPRLGAINVHGSLLPRYRGGAPIQRSIMNGETETGVTIMYMAEGLDTGDMISRVVVPITHEDTSGSMFDKLSLAGATLLEETLPAIIAETIQAQPQNHEESTYAPNLNREDELLVWDRSAAELYNQVRALLPEAGAFTTLHQEAFKVWECEIAASDTDVVRNASGLPGTIIGADREGIYVKTGDGVLLLRQVQPAGKKVVRAADWYRGIRADEGLRFGSVDGEEQ